MTVKGSVLDVAAERLLGVRAGDIMGDRLAHQPGRQHQRLDVRRAACLLCDGARRRVLPGGGARPSDATRRRLPPIAAQAAWATVLILTGSLDALGNYVGFAITLFAGIAVAAVFVLRARDPHAPRPVQGGRLSGDARDLRRSSAW